jgi:hypothetical protein
VFGADTHLTQATHADSHRTQTHNHGLHSELASTKSHLRMEQSVADLFHIADWTQEEDKTGVTARCRVCLLT